MKTLLTSRFSQIALKPGISAKVKEISLKEAREILSDVSWKSVINHETEANAIGALFGFHVPTKNASASALCGNGDKIICVVANLKSDLAGCLVFLVSCQYST